MNMSLFGSRIEAFARRVGRSAARTPLLLYYVLQSNDTSIKDKAIIASCLAYVILPIDIIPSRKYSILGWADELLSIEIVYDRMRKYITPEMLSKADAQLDKWIPTSQLNNKTTNQNTTTYQGNSVNPTTSFPKEVENISKKW